MKWQNITVFINGKEMTGIKEIKYKTTQKMQIENTKAFKALNQIAQKMINKRANRLQIEDSIIQAKTIGFDAWKAQTGLPLNWQPIVKEIVLS